MLKFEYVKECLNDYIISDGKTPKDSDIDRHKVIELTKDKYDSILNLLVVVEKQRKQGYNRTELYHSLLSGLAKKVSREMVYIKGVE